MNPRIIRQIRESDAVSHFCELFELNPAALHQRKLYDGAANLLYHARGKAPAFLRISYRKDRNPAMIESELHYMSYLAEHGFSCPIALSSSKGNLLEVYRMDEHELCASLLSELKGKHMYEMSFRLPHGMALDDFWRHCGKTLGTMHELSRRYLAAYKVTRFTWLDRHQQSLAWLFLEHPEYRQLINAVVEDIRQIPQSSGSYGICHNDFNVGNFLLDYDCGSEGLKTLDFDDCGFNYYMYDLACFWEMCTGWAINLADRPDWPSFMHRCFSTMLEEYHHHFCPDFDPQQLLPRFLKAAHIENILEPLRELHYSDKALIPDKEIMYHLYCLQHELDYMGLYSEIFNPNKPFTLA